MCVRQLASSVPLSIHFFFIPFALSVHSFQSATYRIIWLWLQFRQYYFLICIYSHQNPISVTVWWLKPFERHTYYFRSPSSHIVHSLLSFRLRLHICELYLRVCALLSMIMRCMGSLQMAFFCGCEFIHSIWFHHCHRPRHMTKKNANQSEKHVDERGKKRETEEQYAFNGKAIKWF